MGEIANFEMKTININISGLTSKFAGTPSLHIFAIR